MNVSMRRFAIACAACAGTLGLAAFASADGGCAASKMADQPKATGDIVDTAVAAGKFKTLVAAVQSAGLAEALKGPGPFTVFAPTDEAFAKLPAGTVETLLKPENKSKLVDILKFHVVPGSVMAAEVTKASGLTTLEGQRIDIRGKGGVWMADNATITATDVAATNGVIHIIDTVLMPATDTIPATAEKAGMFKTLLTAAKAAGLESTLAGEGPFTVFAPTDEAFGKLPKGTVEDLLKPENRDTLVSVLKYHVVSGRVYSDAAVKAGAAPTLQGARVTITHAGEGVKINGAKVVKADLDAANGVIHVIDAVLMPPKGEAAPKK